MKEGDDVTLQRRRRRMPTTTNVGVLVEVRGWSGNCERDGEIVELDRGVRTRREVGWLEKVAKQREVPLPCTYCPVAPSSLSRPNLQKAPQTPPCGS